MDELLEWMDYIEDMRQEKKVRHKLREEEGNNIVGNGIGTVAISIGHLWMFGGLLIIMNRAKSDEK